MKASQIEEIIEIIKKIYFDNVHGKIPPKKINAGHDGEQGHWLEKQMGITHNADNKPDLHGFEMKNGTKSKTTFGDWSATKYIFKSNCNRSSNLTRSDFLKYFGKPNPKKKNRLSWSGSPCPKINTYNDFGQILEVKNDNSINAIYSFSHDKRPSKATLIPREYQIEYLILAEWSAEDLKDFVENKFNQGGWFVCKKDKKGSYCEICFGKPLSFLEWIKLVKLGTVFFDSGMYDGNSRMYSQWRANNAYWDSVIYKCFK